MRVTMRDALRSIPTNLYDAALIDTISLAPFRVEISAPAMLGVQNIEIATADASRAGRPPWSDILRLP